MQNLHAVLEEGMMKVAREKPSNPVRELGNFMLNYKKWYLLDLVSFRYLLYKAIVKH